MKKIMLTALTGVAAVALAISVPSVASAADLYNGEDYSVYMWSGTSSPGGLPSGYNDQTTSIRNVGFETYCENWDCSGRTLYLNGNSPKLGQVTTGLGFGETWSDRISSVA